VVGLADAYDNIQQTVGDIELGGRLEVRFFGGFETNITPADSFTIVSSDPTHVSLRGTFDNIQNGRVPIVGLPGKSMRVTITNLTVVLDDFPTTPPQHNRTTTPQPMPSPMSHFVPELMPVRWGSAPNR
jgi:hypothetical protein